MKALLVAAVLLPIALLAGASPATATATSAAQILTVAMAGSGSGTVDSNPAGISCPSTCSASFADGARVSLLARPETGSSFSGWSGACSGTPSCTVIMSQAMSVMATFTISTEPLYVYVSGLGSGTVSSSPSGLDCTVDCSHTFDYGTTVTLTATPAAGSVFTGWANDCSGTGTCTVTMDDFHDVRADFAIAPETLTVKKSGNASGIVDSNDGYIYCGSRCSHTYDYGMSVTLHAVTLSGTAKFAGWSGPCSGRGGCTFSMSGAESVTATFTKLACVVPNVKGKKLAAAKSAIGKSHCGLGKVELSASATVRKGAIVFQSPRPGKRLAAGARVNLVVSKGP